MAVDIDSIYLKKVAVSFLLVILVSLIYGYFRYRLSMPWLGIFAAAVVGVGGKYLIQLRIK